MFHIDKMYHILGVILCLVFRGILSQYAKWALNIIFVP